MKEPSMQGRTCPQVPVWEKYFRIGENKLRRLAGGNPAPVWILQNGNRLQVKRKQLERFLDATDTI